MHRHIRGRLRRRRSSWCSHSECLLRALSDTSLGNQISKWRLYKIGRPFDPLWQGLSKMVGAVAFLRAGAVPHDAEGTPKVAIWMLGQHHEISSAIQCGDCISAYEWKKQSSQCSSLAFQGQRERSGHRYHGKVAGGQVRLGWVSARFKSIICYQLFQIAVQLSALQIYLSQWSSNISQTEHSFSRFFKAFTWTANHDRLHHGGAEYQFGGEKNIGPLDKKNKEENGPIYLEIRRKWHRAGPRYWSSKGA